MKIKMSRLREIIAEEIKLVEDKIYLQPGQSAPEGKKVKTGPRGGKFFTGSKREKEEFAKANKGVKKSVPSTQEAPEKTPAKKTATPKKPVKKNMLPNYLAKKMPKKAFKDPELQLKYINNELPKVQKMLDKELERKKKLGGHHPSPGNLASLQTTARLLKQAQKALS